MSDSPSIVIRGACQNNLKNIDLKIPKNRLIGFAGPSGSGKSSLAIGTLFAEGQRRYLESLSIRTRQLLGGLEKPLVDEVRGLSPTLCLTQRGQSAGRRSTVGTLSEITDFLQVLFARLGKNHCPVSGEEMVASPPHVVVEWILSHPEGTRFFLLCPIPAAWVAAGCVGEELRKRGFARLWNEGGMLELGPDDAEMTPWSSWRIVVDRLVVRSNREKRFTDSVELAYELGGGELALVEPEGNCVEFSNSLRSFATGKRYPLPSPQSFSFNSVLGMCPECQGLGTAPEVEFLRLVPDASLSLRSGAVSSWRKADGGLLQRYGNLLRRWEALGLMDPDCPYQNLPEMTRKFVISGGTLDADGTAETWEGTISRTLREWEKSPHSSRSKILSKMIRQVECTACKGTRFNPLARETRLGGESFGEIQSKSLGELSEWLGKLSFSASEEGVGAPLVASVLSRIAVISDLGAGYLELGRVGTGLSGGEVQKLRLASLLNSDLSGVLYVLDEPAMGLHPKDFAKMISWLKVLRDRGNTVILVEHHPELLSHVDWLYDFGPEGGDEGGNLLFEGTPAAATTANDSVTGRYLFGGAEYLFEHGSKAGHGSAEWCTVEGGRKRNLSGERIRFPRNRLTALCGVNGSGKSTFLHEVLYASARLATSGKRSQCKLEGLDVFRRVVRVNQGPLGTGNRMNPGTATGIFAKIRELFASCPEARAAGFGPGRFSPNVRGGRCEKCQGQGTLKVSMVFMPDVECICTDCAGKRFNPVTCAVNYRGLSIAEVYDLSVHQAMRVFEHIPDVYRVLQSLEEVGLGYLTLGQPARTLSGGEGQRIKLARELSRSRGGETLFLLDEPASGLHPRDVDVLLHVFQKLLLEGHTIVVVEHHTRVLTAADWIVEFGSGGGKAGGAVVYMGPADEDWGERSQTGRFLPVQDL